MNRLKRQLAIYIADYVDTELERGNTIDCDTISNAIDAFEGGAHGLAINIKVNVEACD